MKHALLSLYVQTAFIGLLLVGCRSNSVDENQSLPDGATVYYSTEYVISNPTETIENADVIFVGKVLNILPTRWNQENGEYWKEVTKEGVYETRHTAMPVHEIEMEVTRLIVDEIGIGGEVRLTAIGKSPADSEGSANGAIQLAGSPDHKLVRGSEAVIFARQTEIAWRDENPIRLIEPEDGSQAYFDVGRKSVIQLTPGAYLLKGDDGLFYSPENGDWPTGSLDDILQQIQQHRSELVQP